MPLAGPILARYRRKTQDPVKLKVTGDDTTSKQGDQNHSLWWQFLGIAKESGTKINTRRAHLSHVHLAGKKLERTEIEQTSTQTPERSAQLPKTTRAGPFTQTRAL